MIVDDGLMKQWKCFHHLMLNLSMMWWWCLVYTVCLLCLNWTNRHDHSSPTDFSYCWIIIRRYHTHLYIVRRFIPFISFPVSQTESVFFLLLIVSIICHSQRLWLLLSLQFLLPLLQFFFRSSVREELVSFSASHNPNSDPRLSLFSPKVFFLSLSPFLSPMEFWFIATATFGLLNWGHLISVSIVDLIAQILFELNWSGRWHHWINNELT